MQSLFGKEMPVKMRIALSGCPNACTSPMLNEIGVIGRIRPLRTRTALHRLRLLRLLLQGEGHTDQEWDLGD